MTFRTDAPAGELAAVGARLLEEYGAFSVARGPERGALRLEQSGWYVEVLPSAPTLELAGGRVDLRTLSSGDTSGWTMDAGRGQVLGAVHFYAPIKRAWMEEIEARGIEILRYIPRDTMVVRGPASSLSELAYSPYVDWVGPWASAWKLRPGLESVGLVDVRIVVFPGDSPESVVAWLAHRGIPVSSRGENGPGIAGIVGSGDFRWVRARIPAHLLASLASLPSVEFIDSVPNVRVWNAQTAWVLQSNVSGIYRYWDAGLDATGQVIGMSDTGLDYDGAPFRQSASTIVLGDIYNTTDASRRKVVRYVNMGVLTGQLTWPGGEGLWDPWSIKDCLAGHGTRVASTLAGNDDGIGSSVNEGSALQGKIYFQDIGSLPCPPEQEGLVYLPEDYGDLFGPPGLVYNDPDAPVRIHSNSWGGDSDAYDVQARMVDAFVWAHPDMTILFAAGNCQATCPTGSVGTPTTAKSIVSVGGARNPDSAVSGNANDLAPQSARGPTADGRIKPTIVTIFDGDSAMSDGDPFSDSGLGDAHWDGTSYATPAAAGVAAIIRQYFVEGWYPAGRPIAANARIPSAALIRAMLIASGQQVTGSGTVSRSPTDTWPNNEQGFGRVLLSKVLPISGDTFWTQVMDETGSGLLTGDWAEQTFRVATAGPLKFVLAWSDYPGTLGAAKALVNDLDLEVRAPDGTVYRGNHFAPFAQGESLPGGTFDTTNVEEAVILKAAMAGDWTVRVIGANVPVGPQPFAVVATGNLDESYGRVTLDRLAYSERDTVRIAVEDIGATSVFVKVTSGLEAAGEDVPLFRGGPDEIWRGSIETAFGTVATDGVLQVREEDTITVAYSDGVPAHTATATAKVLASGPTIHDVEITALRATSATIEWDTLEPATSEVRYGTSPGALNAFANSTDLVRHHEVSLRALAPGTRYYFDVASRGRVTNTTIDANNGLHYRFETPPLGDVLLVIGGPSFPPEREASYAAALDENGWTWSSWSVADLGLPDDAALRDRRAVIWQVGLEQYPPFNGTERDLIQTYLDRGGRLIVSSHDATWALASLSGPGRSPFATPESAAWVRGVLKADFACDPLQIVEVVGVSGDPISGAFTAGVPYAPHREGAADDEIVPLSSGGTSASMWTDDGQVEGCIPSNRPVGLRWVSSLENGTEGDGAWGGNLSRLAYFAFELTGLDATATDLNPGSSTRSAILDAALRWLVSSSPSILDRDHPDVAILSPNGGTFTGPSIPIDWTASASGPGVGFDSFILDVSADAGVTWTTLATLPGTARSFTWDLTGTGNGDRYRVQITAHDDGQPSLQARDTSDETIAIRRPGGDAAGPTIWAGSTRVGPRPPGAGRLTTFSGTADDRMSGGSALRAAELFLQATEPSSAAAGSGFPMWPADTAFDSPVESVTWQGGLPVAPGGFTCTWVHAQDASGNWGPFGSTCFLAISAGGDDVPPVPVSLDEVLLTNGTADLSVGWRPSYENGLYGGEVAYQMFRAPTARGPFTPVGGPLLVNGSARYTFVDPGAGADPFDYFYQVESVDAAGNTARSSSMGAKVRLAFSSGRNLLGIPLHLTDPTFLRLFEGRAWTDAWTYDGCLEGPGWSAVRPSDPTGFSLPSGRGLWVDGTASDFVTMLGVVRLASTLHMCAGWNLIALPGFAEGVTVQELVAATGAMLVQGFDPAGQYQVRDLDPADVLVTGRGYWVYVPRDVDWTIAGW